MKGNKILYAGASLAVLAIGFAAGTYAYYQNTITGTASGTVLAWNCTAKASDDDGAKGDGEQFTVTLGGLYPGAKGSKTITIASSILADYKVTFDSFSGIGAGSVHPYLNICKDADCKTKINSSDTISGEVKAGGTAAVTFYYNWPYADQKDTYNSTPPSVNINVTCSQK